MTPRALFHPARLARRPVLATQSDERLVDLVRAGSDSAFEAIVERYRRPLMRYVSKLLSPERADDVVQQSFVKAYEAMHRNAAELNLRPWLYRIAHNNALNALRDRGLRHAELDERLDGAERPDQALERAQGLRSLVVAVQALPERQRDAILLRELEGRSYEEIAAALGVTDGAVRQLLNRARHTLRASAAALTPWPLLTRVAGGGSAEPVAARVAELAGVGGAGAVAAKVCATALVTGVAIGGAALAPRGADDGPADAVAAEEARAGSGAPAGAPADAGPGAQGVMPGEDDRAGGGAAPGDRSGRRDGDGSGRREDERGERSGSGRGDSEDGGGDGESRSGSGRGDGEDRSGPGGGDGEDRSGPGGGDRDRSGPGDGDRDHSGSGGGDGLPDLHEEDRSGSDSGSEPEAPEIEDAADSSGPGSGGSEPLELSPEPEQDNSGPG